jgi:hypothetical protein
VSKKKNILKESDLKRIIEDKIIEENSMSFDWDEVLGEEVYNIFEDEEFDPLGHIDSEEETEDLDELGVDPTKDCVLGFSNGNAKLEWPYFSLPAGYTCPFATACKNFPAKWEGPIKGGKFVKPASWEKNIKPGPKAKHMCYAARAQGQYPGSNIQAFKNLNLIKKFKSPKEMADLIIRSMKYHKIDNTDIFRIHEAGDFFSQTYFDAWLEVARRLPGTMFYAYTVSLPFWIARKGQIPHNFKLIASMDEENEQTIYDNNLRYSKMVSSVDEAQKLGLPIDVDDSIAWGSDVSFALLLHGPQPKGSKAAQALRRNKEAGMYGKEGIMGKAKERNQAKKDKLRATIRKQLRNESINEGWFSKSEEDKIVLKILNRVKQNFPYDVNKTHDDSGLDDVYRINFTLGGTPIEVGWEDDRDVYDTYVYYWLKVNNNNIKASNSLIKKLYRYIDNNIKDEERRRRVAQANLDLDQPNYAEDVFDSLEEGNMNEGWLLRTREDKVVLDVLRRVKKEFPEDAQSRVTGRFTRYYIIEFTLGNARIEVTTWYDGMGVSNDYQMEVNGTELQASKWAIRKLYKYMEKVIDKRDREEDTTQIQVDLIDPDYAEDVFDALDNTDMNENVEWVKDVPSLNVGDIIQISGYEDWGDMAPRFEVMGINQEKGGYYMRNTKAPSRNNLFTSFDLANKYIMNGEWFKLDGSLSEDLKYWGVDGDKMGPVKEDNEWGGTGRDLSMRGHRGYDKNIYVHRNLNAPPYFSVKKAGGATGGKVIGYDTSIHLEDVKFIVGERGNKEVLPKEFGGEGKAKNVHAGAVGKHVSSGKEYDTTKGWRLVRYNPRAGHTSFIYADTEEPIYSAKEVILKNGKEVWVKS